MLSHRIIKFGLEHVSKTNTLLVERTDAWADGPTLVLVNVFDTMRHNPVSSKAKSIVMQGKKHKNKHMLK